MNTKPQWNLLFILPYLEIAERDRDHASLTLGLEGLAITTSDDPRVGEIRGWSKAADKLLKSFHSEYGEKISPSVLIGREDWLSDMERDVRPIIAFRNAVAMACILVNRARGPQGNFIGSSWTDTFDFHSIQLGTDGADIHIFNPALKHWMVPIDSFKVTLDPGLPRKDFGASDDLLAVRLGRVWLQRYRAKHRVKKADALFRSLDTAYLAASIRFKNYGSLNEAGLGAVLWVSAVEVLASQPGQRVSRHAAVDLIGEYDWKPNSRLADRRWRMVTARKNGRVSETRNVNLCQRLYDLLNEARNKFVHGDSISVKLLQPFDQRTGLVRLASTVYRAALGAYLARHFPWEPSLGDRAWYGIFSQGEYERHLEGILSSTDASS